jgi:hypothetical protein
MDFQIAVVRIGLAGEQALKLALRRLGLQPLELGLRFRDRALIALGLAELGERERILEPALQPAHGGGRRFQMGALAHQRLRGAGVVPEIGVLGLGVQLVEPPERAIPVKDASSAAPTTCGCRRRPLRSRRAWEKPFGLRGSDAGEADRGKWRQVQWAPAAQ